MMWIARTMSLLDGSRLVVGDKRSVLYSMQDSTGSLYRGRGRQMRPSDKPPVVNSVWPLTRKTRLLLFLSVRLSLS
jgi:hypothetical protein